MANAVSNQALLGPGMPVQYKSEITDVSYSAAPCNPSPRSESHPKLCGILCMHATNSTQLKHSSSTYMVHGNEFLVTPTTPPPNSLAPSTDLGRPPRNEYLSLSFPLSLRDGNHFPATVARVSAAAAVSTLLLALLATPFARLCLLSSSLLCPSLPPSLSPFPQIQSRRRHYSTLLSVTGCRGRTVIYPL